MLVEIRTTIVENLAQVQLAICSNGRPKNDILPELENRLAPFHTHMLHTKKEVSYFISQPKYSVTVQITL
jgi:hypothetical protein